eukprot:SAG31_NODE_15237_length_764_cov_1.013534_2_plen_103_part_01
MPYFPFAYWIQPNNSRVYESGSCPRCNSSVQTCGPTPSAPCGPCPGTGKPNPSNFSVFASDTSCHLDEPDENFYDHGLATNTIARLNYVAQQYHQKKQPFFIM